jgi:hypothetical protein
VIDILKGVSAERVPYFPWIAQRAARDALVPFAMGILACTLLYFCAWFFEAKLAHRKLEFDRNQRVGEHIDTRVSR